MEQFTTLGQSTLNGAITSGATTLVVTSAASFPSSPTFRVRIDNEILKVTGVSGTTFTVSRGTEGTTAASHIDTSTVTEEYTAAAHLAFQSDTLGLASQADLPGGKGYLATGSPIPTTDITNAATLYYGPHVSNVISLWDGSYWQRFTFAEVSLALGTVSASVPIDVFGYINSGALALEKLAFSSALVRATGISLQDGRYWKTGDKTRLWLGTIMPTSTTTTEDSEAQPFVFNAYHRAPRRALGQGTYSTNVTSTSTSYVSINAALNTQILLGLPQVVDVSLRTSIRNDSDVGQDAFIGVQVDGGTIYDMAVAPNDKFGSYVTLAGSRGIPMGAGLHTLSFMWKLAGLGSLNYDGGTRGSISNTAGTRISCVISR